MPLHHLHTTKSAQFYRRTGRIQSVEIDALFNRASANAIGGPADRIVKSRKIIKGRSITVSYLRFEFESEPSFLSGSSLKETKHAYILIAELDHLVAIFRKHVTSPDRELSRKIQPIEFNTLAKLFMADDSEYERVSMRAMSVSDGGIRFRSYEAKNLKTTLSAIGASRSVLSSVRVRADGEVHALTPSTSRVARSSGRSSFPEMMTWALDVEQEILGFVNTQGFIDLFAKPIRLSDLPAGTTPSGIQFAVADLERDVLDEQTTMLIGLDSAGHGQELSSDICRRLFDRLDKGYLITNNGNDLKFRSGKLKQNKNSFSVSSRLFDRIRVRGVTGQELSLTKYLNQEQSFLISFTQPQFAYYVRQVFEDQRLLGNIDSFLEVFDDSVNLTGVNSEKGQMRANITRFANTSLFRVVEDSIAQNHEILLCDDLGDEWADHIAVNSNGSPEISLIHSKHKSPTMSASAFQDVVGQALKNLSRLFPSESELNHKITGWQQKYSTTNINRIRRSNSRASVVSDVLRASASPNCVRRVILAVTFLSKSDLTRELTNLRNQVPTQPHIIQLLWILSTFVNGCMEFGAQPKVYCRQ